MVRVYVIEDHRLIILGLRDYFKNSKNIYLIGHSDRIDTATQEIRQAKPDVVLLDLFLKRLDPIQNFRQIRESFPLIPIIILTCESSFYWKARMMKEGAKAYILKEYEMENLHSIVLSIAEGQTIIPVDLMDHNGNLLNFNTDSECSDNDFELITLLSQGLAPKDISRLKHVTYSAVNYQITCLVKKYQAKTVPELIRIFFEVR